MSSVSTGASVGSPTPFPESAGFQPFAGLRGPAPDSIFAVNSAFNSDPRPEKVNLGIGVYRDEEGKTSLLDVVRKEQIELSRNAEPAGYLPILGHARFREEIQALVLGTENVAFKCEQLVTAQTCGGTGALSLGAKFLHDVVGVKTIGVSDPSWDNHHNVFSSAGFEVRPYPYYSKERQGLDFEGMLAGLSQLPPGSAVLLHACCHNPTGVDLTTSQWQEVLNVVAHRGIIPFFDFAYQGFGAGVHTDAYAPRTFATRGISSLVAYSCSKSFSLYERRTGALLVRTSSVDETKAVQGHLEKIVRGTISNPPAEGARIVASILSDSTLSARWHEQLGKLRLRIEGLRGKLVEGLSAEGVDVSHIEGQRGMFSYTGFSPRVVERLRRDFGVYLLDSGRLCVPALNKNNLEYVCSSIGQAVRASEE